MHVDMVPNSMEPALFMQHFCQGNLHPIYFRYQVNFLLFLFKQGLTSATASTDIKKIFKSVSNLISEKY